jgi:NTP pyrophosphatase (non-canonical NTP hydrolase)
MNTREYIDAVLKTESPLFKSQPERIMHSIYGCVTEAGEMMDNLKRATFYKDKLLDKPNLVEEIGDMCWYLAIMCDELKISFEEVFDKNITKLKIRYPDKFQTARALNRDINAEQEVFKK